MHPDPLCEFNRRIRSEWLPAYCNDPKRQYSPAGFRSTPVRLSATDAEGCMRAIDLGVVKLVGHARYRAARGRATEPLFWDGLRRITPRPITLWLEPVITFAALAKLHIDFGWPVDLLANQPRSWAFDIAAHNPARPESYRILAEVKKTEVEAKRLVRDLLNAIARVGQEGMNPNSAKKWAGLAADRPPVLWIVGPAGYSRAFTCTYAEHGAAQLTEASHEVLHFDAA